MVCAIAGTVAALPVPGLSSRNRAYARAHRRSEQHSWIVGSGVGTIEVSMSLPLVDHAGAGRTATGFFAPPVCHRFCSQPVKVRRARLDDGAEEGCPRARVCELHAVDKIERILLPSPHLYLMPNQHTITRSGRAAAARPGQRPRPPAAVPLTDNMHKSR